MADIKLFNIKGNVKEYQKLGLYQAGKANEIVRTGIYAIQMQIEK